MFYHKKKNKIDSLKTGKGYIKKKKKGVIFTHESVNINNW